jgi:hypothetical protein
MKVVRKTGFHLIVEPRRLGDLGSARMSDSLIAGSDAQIEAEYHERCEEIASEIRRHVRNVAWIHIEHDTEEICSFCNYRWEVSTDDADPEFPKGCPLCCEAAISEWKEEA